MSLDLEQRLEADLGELANRTRWTPGDVETVRKRSRQRRHRMLALRAVCVLVVVAGAVGMIALRTGPRIEPSNANTGAQEAKGREVPLAAKSTQPASDALSRSRWSLIADGRFEVELTLRAAFADGSLEPTACVRIGTSGPCYPLDPTTHQGVPQVIGSDALMAWTTVPPGTSYVQFEDATTNQWQRPIDGVVAFPVTNWHAVSSLIARDTAGNELGRADLSTLVSHGTREVNNGEQTSTHEYYSSAPSASTPTQASPDPTATRERLATNLMTQCVGGHTALEAWWRCLDETNARLQQSSLAHPLPALAATTIDGRVLNLSDRTGHWLVLEFTSSSCTPCTDLLPTMRDFNRQQSQLDDGAELYSIETLAPDDAAAVRTFYDAHPTTWPVLLDEDNAIAAAFGINSTPEIWIVDPLGNIVRRIPALTNAAQLNAELEAARAQQS